MAYEITQHLTCDAAVLGGGGSGLVAAARLAKEGGKKVIVVEKSKHTGGGASQAGDFRVYGSKWQKDRNLPDNLNEDLLKRMDETFWELDRKLVLNAFLATGQFFDWCCTLAPDCADRFEPGRYVFDKPDRGPIIPTYAGLPSERKGPGGPGDPGGMGGPGRGPGGGPGEAPEGMLAPGAGMDKPDGPGEGGGMPMGGGPGMRTGTYLMKLMKETCDKYQIPILLEHRVVDVLTENGKLQAVIVEGPNGTVQIDCKAIILATGSWISNQKYLEMASPVFAKMDPGTPTPGGHRNCNYTGDGIPIAEKLGALVDYDSFCIRPMGPGLVSKNGGPVFARGQMANAMVRSPYCLQVDEQGFRYTCEPTGTRFAAEDAAHVVLAHGSTTPFCVFDLNTAKYTAEQAKNDLALGKEGGIGGPASVNLDPSQVEADLDQEKFMLKADTIEELADQMGVPAENLRYTIDLYNESCKNGFDSDCFKQPEYLVPLTGPYYAFVTALNTDGAFGGVKVNADIQAYAKDGKGLVEGLWVPGDFASGRFVNDRGLKRQIINDLAWAFGSAYLAADSCTKYLNTL